MYLFFMVCFILVSVSLIFLILLQPNKGLVNSTNFRSSNNIHLFNIFSGGNFITNMIALFSVLFLIISIILCNINGSKMNRDDVVENNKKMILLNSNQ